MSESVPELVTPRLRLRGWSASDVAAFAALNADPRVVEYLSGPLSYEQSAAMVERLDRELLEHGFGLWAVEIRATGQCAGFIGIRTVPFEEHFTPAVEAGWRLAAEHWGQGYATEGARAALQFGFEHVGLKEIVSFTAVINTRSRRVMEKLGMTHDAQEDFAHPRVPVGNPLRRHVLYRLTASQLL